MGGNWKHGLLRAGGLAVAALVACALVIFLVWRAWLGSAKTYDDLDHLLDSPSPVTLDERAESQVVAFCSDCHALPSPESFPREAWYDKVRRGYEYYARSGRNDLDPPLMLLTTAYYLSRALETLAFGEPAEAENELRAVFTRQQIALGPELQVPPAVSHLHWTRLEPDGDPRLLVCDMRNGGILSVDVCNRQSTAQLLAQLDNPCRVEPCDLDGDQTVDLVVADLGSVQPYDHDLGRVVWLRRQENGQRFEQVELAAGLGRVADVRPADFDGDGDLDLIVAEFGHYLSGSVVLLRNVSGRAEPPRFEPEELDPRPGTIHTPVHDFNEDGRPDFLALVSQEYESLDAFVNQPEGGFRLQTMWTAPDLTFGSSGIELVDLDQDEDMDVLQTNGDAFDNSYVNPSHGIQWFENLGNLQFAYHRLADMTGAYCARAGDVDLDGDLDVVAVAWLPPYVNPPNVSLASLPSILCLEQTSPGEFVRHTLERGAPYYASLEMADFDGDGDLDFAVGYHVMSQEVTNTPETPHRVFVWWNQVIAEDE